MKTAPAIQISHIHNHLGVKNIPGRARVLTAGLAC